MNKSLITALLLSMTVLTACDSLRKFAGRPTSEDIAFKRAEIVRMKEIEHRIMMDSLAKVEREMSDSLAKVDSAESAKADKALRETVRSSGKLRDIKALGNLETADLPYRYYIMVGSFKEKANAQKMLGIVQEAGYPGTMIVFRTGINAVGICPTNDLEQALANLEKLVGEKFCPPDAWIVINE